MVSFSVELSMLPAKRPKPSVALADPEKSRVMVVSDLKLEAALALSNACEVTRGNERKAPE